MASKLKTKYKNTIFFLTSMIFLLMICTGDSPLELGHDLIVLDKTGENLYSLFKSVYYIPNMIIPIISGFIIDYIGLTYVLVTSSCFGIIGQLYMFLYISNDIFNFEFLFVGRILYSISCETICVSTFSYIAIWFQNLKIGQYFGLLIGLNGLEYLFFTLLQTHLFKDHTTAELNKDKNIRERYIWLFAFNLILAVIVAILTGFIYKIDKKVQDSERKIPVLIQHPDKLMGFWRILKKSLRQNFLIICIIYAFMYSCFLTVFSNVHQMLEIILWGSQPSCNSREHSNLSISEDVIHIFAVILTILSDTIMMMTPFFVGRSFIKKKKRYLIAFFGCFLMAFSICLSLAILEFNCGDPALKMGIFIVSLAACTIGYCCQNGLLYASVALMTKVNFIGTRFGILHAVKNFIYFFFITFEFTSLEGGITENEQIQIHIQHYKEGFWKVLSIILFSMMLYLVVISRVYVEKKDSEKVSSVNIDEMSTFIKKDSSG